MVESDFRKNSSKNKDDRLFFGLFMTSQKSIYAFILASVRNFDDANDILQDTATIMWRRFHTFHTDTSFEAWGISIARNLIKQYFRARKRARLQFDQDLIEEITKTTLSKIDFLDKRLEALKKCCERLTQSNRNLLDMRYSKTMTVKEIADVLGKPVQGMYKVFARLQDSLQRCIDRVMRFEAL